MVGKVVDKIDALGIRENTLIIWTADNGTYTGIKSEFDGREYKGGKGSPKDNGTHVGFVASWPGTIRGGQVSEELVDHSDVFPTVAELAGRKCRRDGLDGVSLVPTFHGKPREKDVIYCWYERNGVREKASQHTRDQRYKLYATGKFFDTVDDPLEENDLAADGVPEPLSGVYRKLKAVLDVRVEETKKMDAVIGAKRKAGKKAKK